MTRATAEDRVRFERWATMRAAYATRPHDDRLPTVAAQSMQSAVRQAVERMAR